MSRTPGENCVSKNSFWHLSFIDTITIHTISTGQVYINILQKGGIYPSNVAMLAYNKQS